jgi:hypothetical protein
MEEVEGGRAKAKGGERRRRGHGRIRSYAIAITDICIYRIITIFATCLFVLSARRCYIHGGVLFRQRYHVSTSFH